MAASVRRAPSSARAAQVAPQNAHPQSDRLQAVFAGILVGDGAHNPRDHRYKIADGSPARGESSTAHGERGPDGDKSAAPASGEARDPRVSASTLGRYEAMVARLYESVLRSPAALDVPRREAAATGDLDGPAGAFVRKVRESSYKVMDEDFTAMKASGLTEEEIFELLVSAALGAAKDRLDRANAVLRGRRSG